MVTFVSEYDLDSPQSIMVGGRMADDNLTGATWGHSVPVFYFCDEGVLGNDATHIVDCDRGARGCRGSRFGICFGK